MEQTAEVRFAQKLAANEKKPRDQALKKLQKYLALKSSSPAGLSDDDLIKIWKGLFYCMWMQDKPLIHEELSGRIAGLVTVFQKSSDSIRFVKVFFITMAREWIGIDKWRLDKYLMMIRDIVAKTFRLVASNSWSLEICQQLSSAINSAVVDPENDKLPEGLRIHLADMFMDEICKTDTAKLKMEALLTLTLPFLRFIIRYPKINMVELVIKGIITEMLDFIQDRKSKKQKKETTQDSEGEEEMEVEHDSETVTVSDDDDAVIISDEDDREDAVIISEDEDTRDEKEKNTENSEMSPKPIDKALITVLGHMFKMSHASGVKAANRAAVYKVIKLYPGVLAALNSSTEDNDTLSQVFKETETVQKSLNVNKKKKKRKVDKSENSVSECDQKGNGDNDNEMIPAKKQKKVSKTGKSKKDSDNIAQNERADSNNKTLSATKLKKCEADSIHQSRLQSLKDKKKLQKNNLTISSQKKPSDGIKQKTKGKNKPKPLKKMKKGQKMVLKLKKNKTEGLKIVARNA